MERPLVSVAVITYGMERYLRPLLDSILKQQVDFRYEIVIDDDCSPDGSRDIILEYGRRFPDIVKPRLRDSNVGGSRNMFGVLQGCSGKYVAILEGDDFWEDERKLQYQVDFLEAHPEYVGMTCNSWCDHGEVPEYGQLMRDRTEPRTFTFADFQTRHFRDRLPSSTDTWVFRNFLKDGGEYSILCTAHPMVWDQTLILLLYAHGTVYADPRVVSHHRSVTRMDGTNWQSLIRRRNCLAGDDRMYQALERYIVDVLHRDCGRFRLQRGDVWIDAVFRALLSRHGEDASIAWGIWREQDDKRMLCALFAAKVRDVLGRKIRRALGMKAK